MSIYIPEGERQHVTALLGASSRFLEALCAALSRAKPSLKLYELEVWLASELSGLPEAEKPTIHSIVRTLTSLYQFRAEDSGDAAKVAQDFAEAARTSDDERLRETVRDWAAADWNRFEQQLIALLSLDDTLGVTARAALIGSQTFRHFHDVRVLTDARPIFAFDPDKGPAAFVIMHSLQIDYYEDGEDRTWFLALDGDDLETLRAAVDRALAKERSLRKLLERTEVPTMSWQDSADDE